MNGMYIKIANCQLTDSAEKASKALDPSMKPVELVPTRRRRSSRAQRSHNQETSIRRSLAMAPKRPTRRIYETDNDIELVVIWIE
jgi:hypothetical protein